ncbi:MAG: DUF5685 family protein [Oscillospiraceae bacterium]|nr:DUF5685 family protein [Oscillospiraceae bacterium]
MFGFLTADRGMLTAEEDLRYRGAYCGLCRNLRRRYGTAAGFTLNYDLCFLILLLQSLYEEPERDGEEPCIAHPVHARKWWECCFTDYAADMNMALSYLKLRDNWEDDGNLSALAVSAGMKKTWRSLAERYPRQCGAMERSIGLLRDLERDKTEDPDAAAETFAVMMSEIFVCRDDRWSDTLRAFGAGLGRFLYVADACVDLDRDTLRGSYNPFRRYYGLKDNGECFRDILRMLLGECMADFDRLPLVLDADLLKNILCFGLWTEFDRKYNTTDGTNSHGF